MTDDISDRPTDEDLHAFALGTLAPEKARLVQAALDSDAALAADVAFMRGLKSAVQDDTDAPAPPGEFGWKRLEAEINKTSAAQPRNSRWLQIAAAVLAGICVLQGAALMRGNDGYQTASLVEYEHVLAISFAPETTEADLRDLLLAVSARIVEGPTSAGLYRVAFDDEAGIQAGIETLSQSNFVALVAEE